MKNELVSYTIDWLSVTQKIPSYHSKLTKKYIPMRYGSMGYDLGIKFIDGRITLSSQTRKDMGFHTIYSGDVIRLIESNYGVNPVELVKFHTGDKVTRIDLAIDVFNKALDIKALSEQLHEGKAKTRTRYGLFYEGRLNKQGMTLYVGSPKSDKRVRIYDKKAESNRKDIDSWERIEMQIRGKHASVATSEIAASDTSKVGNRIKAMINSYITFPENKQWIEVMGNDEINITVPKSETTSRREWLQKTIIYAIVNEVVESKDGENWLTEFYRTITELVEEKRNWSDNQFFEID